MLFSNLVATFRADLDAIKGDLDEFVHTVKHDTTKALGLNSLRGGAGEEDEYQFQSSWEEEMWDHPEWLVDDLPGGEEVDSPKEEEESLLTSRVVQELYRELVPAKTTHAEFVRKLVFHKRRLQLASRLRMADTARDVEETAWEDDEDEERMPGVGGQTPPVVVDAAAYEDKIEEMKKLMEALQDKIAMLETALRESETKREELESRLQASDELIHPHSKKVPVAFTPSKSTMPVASDDTPSLASWEALPSPQGADVPSLSISSSEELPVVLNKVDAKDGVVVGMPTEEEEEEEEWE